MFFTVIVFGLVMIFVLQPFVGLIYTVRSFMIVILAGLGNLGAVIGAARA